MIGFLRFVGWATLLSPLCWLASHGWQRGLAAAVNAVLSSLGIPVDFARIDVASPFDIGLFVALCLASRHSPRAARRRALLLGIPAMMAVEVLLASVAIGLMVSRGSAGLQTDPVMRAGFYLTDTIPWVSGPVLWVVLLGGWELPFGRRPPHPPRTPRDST